ncbi:nuclear apoptosis-inducing factor 1-like isoform X2 [Ruditapes philippinarum]|uniref:nuclear apoptosis-inducing factor 1-like isoform X2 n=1 Tax=Ruditapes philippinarum TaxID=129788 RepID=UPI00295B830E|nr:nuclear apoptosis-inducing factor 1-like isoform X2 [Ruditapes philippinarum]
MSNLKYDVCYNSAMSDKARKVNWTTDERDMLISKCETADVATGKFSQTLTAADKARFWADVVESVNSVSGCSRTLEQVKKKWIDLKSQTKKKTIQYIAETRKTGGGPAPILDLKAWESKKIMILALQSQTFLLEVRQTLWEERKFCMIKDLKRKQRMTYINLLNNRLQL